MLDKNGCLALTVPAHIVKNPLLPALLGLAMLGSPLQIQAQPRGPGQDRGGQGFDRQDADGDGKLSRSEFRGPNQAFDRVDANGDGFITREEARNSRGRGPQGPGRDQEARQAPADAEPLGKASRPLIDIHSHLNAVSRTRSGLRKDYDGAARAALEAMQRYGIKEMLLMPPPFPPGHRQLYEIQVFSGIAAENPGKFAFIGGGGTLNPLIQQAMAEGGASEELKKRFESEARALLSQGAVGFGEFALEHLCLGEAHNHQDAPADHPLLLLLADIAAEAGTPLDLHLEAVETAMPLPARFKAPPNPKTLEANIPGLERLLAHNRKAAIIWSHAGWDNTGVRTVALMDRLLKKHPNLYMSVKVSPEDSLPESSPVEADGTIKEDWLGLLARYPDRFLIGMDHFFVPAGQRRTGPPSLEPTMRFFAQLPEDLARKIGLDNPRRLFRLLPREARQPSAVQP